MATRWTSLAPSQTYLAITIHAFTLSDFESLSSWSAELQEIQFTNAFTCSNVDLLKFGSFTRHGTDGRLEYVDGTLERCRLIFVCIHYKYDYIIVIVCRQ